MDGDAARAATRQHHEMIHVPVQDAGQPQLRRLGQRHADRPALQRECVRHGQQQFQVHALQRDGKAGTQGREIAAMTPVAGDHGKAGQCAFGGLALQHQRQAHPLPEAHGCGVERHAHVGPARLRNGSNSHSASCRRSSAMLALTAMPAFSASGSP